MLRGLSTPTPDNTVAATHAVPNARDTTGSELYQSAGDAPSPVPAIRTMCVQRVCRTTTTTTTTTTPTRTTERRPPLARMAAAAMI